ncbi:MAG: hypothetical protein A2888_01765 [Chlamydiae bacterium RIFCSPLOWO2_01_FULL_28_7]|nr:MAG: hypothetical protein A2888_01765 [Chlamydiae bacterium RIFCSPLOWO2_01_FULL_28_7]
MTLETQNYFNKEFLTQPFAIKNPIFLEKCIIFVHEHPKIVKISKISLLIIGTSLSGLAFYTSSALAFTAVLSSGILVLSISILALKVLDLISPPVHDMKYHSYIPFDTKEAQLFYKQDVPILKIKTEDPYASGFAIGSLLGKQISEIRDQWSLAIQKLPEFLFLHTTPIHTKVKVLIEEVKKTIPDQYLNEMKGIVAGFNKYRESVNFLFRPSEMSLEELILFHLEPDIRHINHIELNRHLSKAMACTSIVDVDSEDGIVLGRNTDWPTFGVAGKNSLVICRTSAVSKIKTAEITVPGFIGTLAAMNEHGLSVSMNICNGKTTSVSGIPNALFTRYIFELSRTVQEIEANLEKYSSLGAYHLIAADEHEAKAFFIKQDEGFKFKAKLLEKTSTFQAQNPLFITNFRYEDLIPSIKEEDDVNFSVLREQHIRDFYLHAKSILKDKIKITEIVKKALSLPYVNNLLSAHTALFITRKREIRVAFDNAYSAKNQLTKLDREVLF